MKIRIGIVGAGGMTAYHIPGFRKGGSEVVAVADPSAAAAAACAERWGVKKTYASLTDMLAGETLDAVSVITPNRFHAPLAIEALKAGKHVFCEKPPALNAKETVAMAKAAGTIICRRLTALAPCLRVCGGAEMKTFVVAAFVAAACCGADMPLDANAELATAYRCDLPGPEVWTITAKGVWVEGTSESYAKSEVPVRRFGTPAPGMSGQLCVAHMVDGLKDAVGIEVAEGNDKITLVPVRNNWTPAFMTTYYRSLPNAASNADQKRIGRIVLKERKAILADNTFIAEATLKNTSSLPLKCRVSVIVRGGLPAPG